MKKLLLLTLLVPVLSTQARERDYATNAVATVNMSVVALKPQTPPSPTARAKAMVTSAMENSFSYNNLDEIEKAEKFIKDNNLQKEFKLDLEKNIPAMKNRAIYESEWSFYKSFIYSQGVGLLDENEYLQMKNKLEEIQVRRYKKNKNEAWAKADKAYIEKFVSQYKEQREKQIETSRQSCKEETDWSSAFSPRKGQTDTSWCYAFGYADFLEATSGQSVSAADLVLQYRSKRIQEERDSYNRTAALYKRRPLTEEDIIPVEYVYQGGDADQIFRKQSTMSLCSEESLRSEARDEKGQPVAMGYIIDWIKELGSEYQASRLSKNELTKKLETFGYKQLFPFAKIDEALAALNPKNDLYIALAESTCKDKRIELPNQHQNWVMQGYTFTYSLNTALAKLNENLNQSPAMISVNDNFLYKENIWGKGLKTNHLILVTGRRWNEETKHCEFKIRNSQTMYSNEEERLWYSDTELLRNTSEIYIKGR